ncbi:CLUMA_CG019384, isoform A [Clunio marinus]|uniref:CLUMA_CG019384, isoform A n=1 Tax=Clunio marinus TaxID=568069 RepID=A0A1J1J1K5_9DIPT|nr:CLUMA_CG019384, isoform A [Clunio marinus]
MDPKQQQQYCAAPDMMVQSASTGPKSKAQLNSGNYINVVPMAVVNSGVQYHHRSRKYPPPQMTSDYQ